LDLNHIFLFIAVISPLLVLARAWRPEGIFRGWRIAAATVLTITGVAWLFFREYAGYVGGGAWFALLLLPAVGLRKASQLAAHGRYQSARRLTALLQFLHPTAQVRDQLQLFQNLESRGRAGDQIQGQSAPQDRERRLRKAPAVIAFILLSAKANFGDSLPRFFSTTTCFISFLIFSLSMCSVRLWNGPSAQSDSPCAT
jgi:hypothetical protein